MKRTFENDVVVHVSKGPRSEAFMAGVIIGETPTALAVTHFDDRGKLCRAHLPKAQFAFYEDAAAKGIGGIATLEAVHGRTFATAFLEAVTEADIKNLETIALTSSSADYRFMALERINAPDTLKRIARMSSDARISESALRSLIALDRADTELLKGIAIDDMSHKKFSGTARLALDALSESEDDLVSVFAHGKSECVALAALHKIANREKVREAIIAARKTNRRDKATIVEAEKMFGV